MLKRHYLNPARKLVDEVADWLCGKIETDDAGARSLAHVLVVVPTAQSGRSLRLRLAQRVAERFGGAGLVPPQVVQPMRLVVPRDDSLAVATSVQLRAAFLKFVETRPRRHVSDGRTELDEWQTLFRPDFIADSSSHLEFFDQLSDIWRILAANGCLMADVGANRAAAELLTGAVGDERRRWEELAEFETAFFACLHDQGLRHEAEAIRLAKTDAAEVPAEIREVVLPALVDPLPVLYDVLRQQRDDLQLSVLLHARKEDEGRFDGWGRPDVAAWTEGGAPALEGIRDADVIRAGNDAELAKRVAADFPAADEPFVRPSLGLCDEQLYSELSAAFLNRGVELHNPERHALSASSLGRLLTLLVDVCAAGSRGVPWEAFAALLRLDDVMTAVLKATPKNASGERPCRHDVLHGLDVCRNVYLPTVVPDFGALDPSRLQTFERKPFAAFLSAAQTLADWIDAARRTAPQAVAFVRALLARIYGQRRLGAADKEFGAAVACAQGVLTAVEQDGVASLGLSVGARTALLRKALAEATYSLEPDAANALKTEGWLELAWSASDKVALAGFHEGSVPDAVVGHAFLPDNLRAALGLTTNARRLARDACLLADLLAARADEPGAVRAYVSLTSNAGDLHRPSRLLFRVAPDRLAARVKALFGELPAQPPTPARKLVDAWRPRLPDEVPLYRTSPEFPEGRLSASAIDTWLKCPFSYLLQYGVGMNRIREKTELEANDFGTLVHRALELYAREQLDRSARGLAQLHVESDIVASLANIMQGLRASYGARPSVNVRLQLDAAEERLKCFARIQARWADEGWIVRAEPEYGFIARPFKDEDGCDVPVKGSVDRIDWKEGVGFRLIDYKTWDTHVGASGRIIKKGVAQAEHAARLGLPVLNPAAEPKDRKRFLSVQLPLYGRCLEKADEAKFKDQIADYCYVILGATRADSVVLGSAFDQGPFEAVRQGKTKLADHVACALDTARVAIRRIRGNYFWPPGPTEEWKWDLKDVLSLSPERDFPCGTAWRDAQEAKLAALASGGEVRT